MDPFAVLLLLAALGGVVLIFVRQRQVPPEEREELAGLTPQDEASLPPHLAHVYSLAVEAAGFYDLTARPGDLLAFRPFLRAVAIVAEEPFTVRDRFDLVFGPIGFLSCVAIEALAQADDPPTPQLQQRLLERLNEAHVWYRFFALRALAQRDERDRAARPPDSADDGKSLFGMLFETLDDTWTTVGGARTLETFVEDRLRGPHGETVRAELEEAWPPLSDGVAVQLWRTLRTIDADLVQRLEEPTAPAPMPLPPPGPGDVPPAPEPEPARGNPLSQVGRFLAGGAEPDWEDHDALRRTVDSIDELLREPSPPSVLLVGEPGVGRTTVVRALAAKLAGRNWKVFESSASSVVADQKYVGQIEQRIRDLVRALGRDRRRVWFLPRFHETLWAGRASEIPRALLHLLMPYVERGELVLLGETSPTGHQRLLEAYPQLRVLMHTVEIPPLEDGQARALAQAWGDRHRLASGRELFAEVSVAEVQNLAKQYLGTEASPGNLLGLLGRARTRAEKRKAETLTREDVLAALAERTGLPRHLLDEHEDLDLAELRTFFESRVMGQPDAVDCLVERLAMVKAGLTDPTRPLGVLLFAGPTGTGKTEMGKVLADYLFGSPDRMIRLDMSELQTPSDLGRVIGDGQLSGETVSLVQRIRSQPFSVILLDEFEKAHRRVWDLFLQMFDDGRLTDRLGNTADFRHSVVIMTSNAGFEDVTASVGFTSGPPFATDPRRRGREMERRLRRTFRPELLNRMDRVVVFRPLDRATMRSLIRKELNDALKLRGLRTRNWAVEWDSSAVDFLLEQGFTKDLGARPLKRAIERHLLAPLARTIVSHEAPEGDQFLFIGSDGTRITVTFVDPDAPTAGEVAVPSATPHRRDLTLESIMLDALGEPEEVDYLHDVYEETVARIGRPEWAERKEAAFARMGESGFWNMPDRFVTLGEAEYLDRIEAALGTAGSLLERLRGAGERERTRYPGSLVQGLSQQLYLLNLACRDVESGAPRDAFLSVETDETPEHGRALGTMYERWARKRRMRSEVLGRRSDGDHYRIVLAVSGFGAHSLLAPESGVHVFELPDADNRPSLERKRVRVRVAPQGELPVRAGDLRDEANQALAAQGETANVVRVYRLGPAPLVRDRVRHWRTGRVERVLEGDFDLLADRT